MKSRQLERVSRAIASAMVSQDLSVEEMLELSERVRHDSRLQTRLSEFLRGVAYAADKVGLTRRSGPRSESMDSSVSEAVEDILELFRRRRLNKAVAFKVLSQASGDAGWSPRNGKTLRENVKAALERVSDDELAVRAVVASVAKELGYSGDPYLRGL